MRPVWSTLWPPHSRCSFSAAAAICSACGSILSMVSTFEVALHRSCTCVQKASCDEGSEPAHDATAANAKHDAATMRIGLCICPPVRLAAIWLFDSKLHCPRSTLIENCAARTAPSPRDGLLGTCPVPTAGAAY